MALNLDTDLEFHCNQRLYCMIPSDTAGNDDDDHVKTFVCTRNAIPLLQLSLRPRLIRNGIDKEVWPQRTLTPCCLIPTIVG